MLRKVIGISLLLSSFLTINTARAQAWDEYWDCDLDESLSSCAGDVLPRSAKFTSPYSPSISTGYYWGGNPFRVWIPYPGQNNFIARNQATGYVNNLPATLVKGEGYYLWQTGFTYAQIDFTYWSGMTLNTVSMRYLSSDANTGNGPAYVTCHNTVCEKYDKYGVKKPM